MLKRYGITLIQALVDTGFDIVVRPHPQSMTSERAMMDELMAAYPEGSGVEWNFDRDNYDVLRRSDVMISDMSGVIHDFALVFDKPVIYSLGGIDTDPFDAAWLDEPFWETPLFTNTGVPIEEEQFPRMRKVIEDVLADPEVRERRRLAREQSWLHRGECARLCVDYLEAKRVELLVQGEEK